MALWMVRAGRHGEQEAKAIDNGFVAIGWIDLPDLSNIRTKGELKRLYNKEYPGRKKMRVANEVGQIWRFFKEISIGDLVALPLKAQSAIAIGKVTGPYEYRKDFGDILATTCSLGLQQQRLFLTLSGICLVIWELECTSTKLEAKEKRWTSISKS